MQYYVPAYLLKGNPQPVISSVSTTKLTYNKAFTVAYTLKNDTLKRCGLPGYLHARELQSVVHRAKPLGR